MIILKVTKNQSFTLFLQDTVFEKPLGRFRANRNKYGDKEEVQYSAPNHGNSGVEKSFFLQLRTALCRIFAETSQSKCDTK